MLFCRQITMNKHALLIGFGPGLATGIVRAFAREGFGFSLVARNAEKLMNAITALSSEGVTAHGFTGDAYKPDTIVAAAQAARTAHGPVDLLIYNAAALKMRDVLDESAADVATDMNACVGSFLDVTRALLPDLEAAKGAVLATGGGLGVNPDRRFGSLSMGKAALRNLVYQLHGALGERGIYVGTVTIGGFIQPSDPTYAPDALAQHFVRLATQRRDVEFAV
jgi:NAD(P)-dependent dehydrogenase (short-subunit alcohol dehydrogenase family)